MNRLLGITLYLTLGLTFLSGCAIDRKGFRGSPQPDHQPVITALAEKAAAYEAADEIQLALFCWRSVLDFDPGHTDAQANLKRLAESATERARASYLKGKEALAQTRPKDARRALLLTLRLDPQFDDARQRLDQFMNPAIAKLYRLQPGESLADLSQKFYGTPDGADLIAFANDIPVNSEVLTPRIVKIPTLSARQPYQTQKTDQALARARRLSKAGRHEKVLVITERLLRENPKLSKAVVVQNNSRFVLGQRLYQQQQYLKSKQMLDKIQGPHQGLQALRADLKVKMKQQAEIYYRDGVKFFLNDELKRAVDTWHLTLALDPEHQEAAASIREAETLLQKLKTVDEE